MTGFSSSIARWVETAKGRGTAVLRTVATEAVARVQELTPEEAPEGAGTLRSNWSALRAGDTVPEPGAPTTTAIATAELGDVIHIVNPVADARETEYGGTGTREDGTAWVRSGHGMVQQTLAELPQIAGRAAKALSTKDLSQ